MSGEGGGHFPATEIMRCVWQRVRQQGVRQVAGRGALRLPGPIPYAYFALEEAVCGPQAHGIRWGLALSLL